MISFTLHLVYSWKGPCNSSERGSVGSRAGGEKKKKEFDSWPKSNTHVDIRILHTHLSVHWKNKLQHSIKHTYFESLITILHGYTYQSNQS
jgi:hypothetical protein